jgi:PAS domain S-box-containing protein
MSSTPLRVLLVEDDDDYAAMIGRDLAGSDIAVGVERVKTLGGAIEALSAGSFDVVLLDLSLPDSEGLETLDRLHAAVAGVTIIVLTSQDASALALQAVQHGAQDYLLKSETHGRLLARAIRYARERATLRLQLAEREARFRALVEYSADAIALIDEDYVALYNSRSVEAISGYTPEELLGRRLDLFGHPDDMPAVNERFAECLANPGRAVLLEFRYQHRDGTWRWGEGVAVNRLHDPAVRAIVVNHREVTSRKQAEQALHVSEERLRQSQKMEAVGRLAGGVAHDFNNALSAIFGYSDLLRDQLPEGDQRRADLDEIRRSAERAASLTRQLLAFSRKQVMEPRVLNLNEVVANVQKLLSKLVGDDVAMDVEMAPDLWPVKADPGQIEQVLMNLAANARDAMPEGGRFVVVTANAVLEERDVTDRPELAPGSYVRLSVSDNGEGMPESVRHHIFEPFFTTKAEGKGTGLGLATVYGIIKQTGGGIYVDSEEGQGTRLDIFLPRVPWPAATSSP